MIEEEKSTEQEWNWWENTDSARDELIKFLEWLNPEEVEKAKYRFTDSHLLEG